ncbi:hypothetical protein EGI15_14585 [Chryseobacterium cucumeris]|uniref:DUF6705 domain-containing protein n=1 Tax=Chryseobacterium cucumeris TaxID=1813611 RepID=A0ABX9X283_9FLAO|nr:DUF6705 family protein [Chryseobacterium cucumeris]ROH89914.1 hypothetical protein EGI15_14585 [Chryseobacterium cucumeris]
MKYLISALIFLTISCHAQIISLEDAAQCLTNPNCPNYNYEKDINNSLNKYVSNWKGTYNGKTYEIQLKKGIYEDIGIKRDKLIGRMKVTDSNGNIVYNSFNQTDDSTIKFNGLRFQKDLKAYMMHFIGNSDFACGEEGIVYLRIKPETPNKISILMLQNADITWGDCPPNYQPIIPYKKSISLTKQ